MRSLMGLSWPIHGEKGLCGDRFCAWTNSLEDHGSLEDKDLDQSRDSPSSRGLDL